MRALALRGGPWSDEERLALLDYCQGDVDALAALVKKMAPQIDLKRALLRGRFMKDIACMESVGMPLDAGTIGFLKDRWKRIRHRFIEEIDQDYGVYKDGHFREDRFRTWVHQNGIEWPLHQGAGDKQEGTRLALDKRTFKIMASRYPQVEGLGDLRNFLSQLRELLLEVGLDGRSRTGLSPFRSKTGRNQPSNARFVFGLSKWSRFLIQPEPGYALGYIDWEQQEFGIAGALSNDPAMQDAYDSGDPYLSFAKQAGAVPPDGTERTHGNERELYKQCALAVQYCMGPKTLAERIGQSEYQARELLDLHHQTYRQFWAWSDASLDYARLFGEIHSAFGWCLHVSSETSERTIRNFPMQANGAEMLRLA